jgi:hypothetical protein
LDPVFANLISVTRVNWLNLVAEVVDETHHGLEVPSFAAQALPYLAVILEWSERYESIVR